MKKTNRTKLVIQDSQRTPWIGRVIDTADSLNISVAAFVKMACNTQIAETKISSPDTIESLQQTIAEAQEKIAQATQKLVNIANKQLEVPSVLSNKQEFDIPDYEIREVKIAPEVAEKIRNEAAEDRAKKQKIDNNMPLYNQYENKWAQLIQHDDNNDEIRALRRYLFFKYIAYGYDANESEILTAKNYFKKTLNADLDETCMAMGQRQVEHLTIGLHNYCIRYGLLGYKEDFEYSGKISSFGLKMHEPAFLRRIDIIEDDEQIVSVDLGDGCDIEPLHQPFRVVFWTNINRKAWDLVYKEIVELIDFDDASKKSIHEQIEDIFS